MLKGKSRIAMLAASGTVAALLVGGLVIASNMGFKGRFQLLGGQQAQWFSPPYTSPYLNADALLNALAPTGGGTIERLIPTAPTAVMLWTGAGGTNFNIKPGEGYVIKPNQANDVVIVGAHNPFVAVPSGQDETGTGPGFVAQREYLISVPWHTTYQVAEDLRLDAGGGATTVTRLEGGIRFTWTGTGGGPGAPPFNFPIVLGQAYLVRPDVTNLAGFVPAHF